MPASDKSDSLPCANEARVRELEFVVAHQQKLLDDLNEAMLFQHKQLDAITRQLEQLRNDVRSAAAADLTPRSLADDKPPHY